MQPPNSPQGFPDYNDPLPNPHGGGGAPGGYPNPPRGAVLSFDVISEAWKLLQPSLGIYIGAILVVAVISGVLSGIQAVASGRDANGAPQNLPIFLVFQLIMFLVNQLLTGGLIRMAVNHVRTGQPQFGDVFSATDVLLNLIIAGILSALAYFVGFLCCIIPGLLLSGLLMFTNFLIVDKKMGAIDAMQTSFNALKPQMWMALAFIIVISLVGAVGVLACCVGVLVTAPLALLSITLAYRDFFMGGTAPTPYGNYPSAPIADPNA